MKKRAILIVGEGRETEPNYFRGLYGEEAVRDRFHAVIKRGIGFCASAAVNLAIGEKAKSDYDQVYCVVDVEDVARRDDLSKAVTLARKHSITLILSNPCFEVWLLSHFERTSRSFVDAAAAAEAVSRHWQAKFGNPYSKGDKQIYQRLKNLTDHAIGNARNVREVDHGNGLIVDCNSSTDVYKLVCLLLGR
ncbi:MAG: RloB family protein [Candidatus Hydrogenedentes bacterium]|nr:RloB family protein [Candidatus Hydrogenedentota bacterium]